MVERLDGRINELIQQTSFDSEADLEATLMNYLKPYYHHIPHRALDAKTLVPPPQGAAEAAHRMINQTHFQSNRTYI
jgi:hypothetical protein